MIEGFKVEIRIIKDLFNYLLILNIVNNIDTCTYFYTYKYDTSDI